MTNEADFPYVVTVVCEHCSSPVLLESDVNGKAASCFRCPVCGHKTCGE